MRRARPRQSQPITPRRRSLLLLIGLLLGLVASLAGSLVAHSYFVRGVVAGDETPPIPHTDVNPLGVNTHLQDEPDDAKVVRTLDMVAAGGFSFIRQPFPWNDIEPAPKTYFDRRHNIVTWAKYDRIVELAVARKIEIIARLDKPPAWARVGQPRAAEIPDGRPNRDADYADFVAAVVGRYQGKVRFIQIWNEPNLEGEWGGQPIDPAAFTELLKVAYTAAKRVDPSVTVLMPGLAPTDQRGPTNLSDLLFLQGMYDAGAKDYFDIATVMVYGYGYSPSDRRVEFARNNFSRPIQTREIMVRNGDGLKPVWAAEYAWLSLPTDWTGPSGIWGRSVSEAEQADYLVEGYRRAQQEWPWMGVMCVWTMRWIWPPDHPDHATNPTRAFAIVNYDFSPRPAYTRLAAARPSLDRAFAGAYRASSRLVEADAGWVGPAASAAAPLRPLMAGATVRFAFSGTRLDLITTAPATGPPLAADRGLRVSIDGRPVTTVTEPGRITVADQLADGDHLAEISALAGGETALGLDQLIVMRQPWSLRLWPWLIGGLIVATLAVISALGWRLRSGARPARSLG